jgi:hypothetical protein
MMGTRHEAPWQQAVTKLSTPGRQERKERMMLPHPVHVIMSVEQRSKDFLAESARDQRARLAGRRHGRQTRQHWAGVLVAVAVVIAILMIVANATLSA